MSQTVLVADDSQTIRKIVEMALKGSAYQVIGVASAQDAMDAARQSPSVILLDYYMPDGSGYDVCRALKANPGTSGIPVVMLGGTYKQFDESLARQSGADGIVMKPFKTDTLMNAIEAVRAGAGAPPPPLTASPNAPTQPSVSGYTQPESRPSQPAPSYSTPEPAAPQQPAPAFQPTPTPPPVQSSPPAFQSSPTPPPAFQSSPSPPPAFQSSPSPPPAFQSSPTPLPVTPTPTPQPTPTPSPASAGSQPRINTPDVNASTRQPTPAPSPSSGGSGMVNVGLSRAEIEKMIREEVKNAVKTELPVLLRNVMGETFQQKVLPKLVEHTEQRVEQLITTRMESQIKEQVRVELERLLSEE